MNSVKFQCQILNMKHGNTYYRDMTIIFNSLDDFENDRENNFELVKKIFQNNIYRDKLIDIQIIDTEEFDVYIFDKELKRINNENEN